MILNGGFRPRSGSQSTSELSAFDPSGPERNVAYWKINGFPARIVVWTIAEWERLEERPTDAQYFPCGIWCALRVS